MPSQSTPKSHLQIYRLSYNISITAWNELEIHLVLTNRYLKAIYAISQFGSHFYYFLYIYYASYLNQSEYSILKVKSHKMVCKIKKQHKIQGFSFSS